ncbi:DNA phosphorothioation-dependent restriction protein DptG [Turicibacter sanguinis]|uniref:DNA phosphorothioation-dependent restriction protein DptG n=1 Tax=Turicibacter sanguinis TaxID=154288 RepID=UPI0018AA0D64|nr:DNA phosphorothioation-dependent restriction protein DptG [Turicibacter sanguinis]MDB8556967.1 DNA phosphorothioation-dependent restriction protein DptG [Turicibacter sanguinis]MDB8559742.1 DNA phosphorothioation-dependent restriction protein DptG [Turicibacter sanguinis]
MSEINNYELYINGIEESFKFTGTGLTHKQGGKYKLLPYVANEKNLVSEFSGVMGSFSRLISDKKLNGEFLVEEFLEGVSEQIAEYEGTTSKETFKDIVRSMFIADDRLVDFDIKTINYIPASSSEDKIAHFLYSILFDYSLKNDVKNYYDKEVENILYKLVLNALPELREEEKELGEYNCYLPFVKTQFIKDFKFILSKEDLYKNSLKRLLEYYYLFYVSQLIMKLDEFETADLNNPSKLYYTLDWERTSKTRTAYQFGWEKIKNSAGSLFSHAVVLEMLNHSNIDEQLGYKELITYFKKCDPTFLNKQLDSLIESYQSQLKEIKWENLKYDEKNSEHEEFKKVHKLFSVVRYQFDTSKSRSRANDAYKNWFVKFVQSNFAKRRGQLGYNLNITEDDIILMTKICINNHEKLKLNALFEEFEIRGLFFDRDSKIKIIQLYEKLNLLEKKSDSGDAQYVKSVL